MSRRSEREARERELWAQFEGKIGVIYRDTSLSVEQCETETATPSPFWQAVEWWYIALLVVLGWLAGADLLLSFRGNIRSSALSALATTGTERVHTGSCD
jgi:hypothetical protein